MIRRAVFWILFACLAALYVYGFRAGGLFTQQIWTPAGASRAAWFTVVYTLAGGAVLLAAPRWFAHALTAAAVLFAAVACGVGALAAVLLVFASSWALGRRAVPGIPGAVLGLNAWALLIGVAVHLPVNVPVVYACAFCLPLAFEWRRMRDAMLRAAEWLRAPGARPRRQAAPAFVAGLVLAMQLAPLAAPEVSADGLAVHLAVPASVAAHHRWVFDARHTAWAVMPMQADWCFTAAYLLGGESAARLFNFGAFLLLAAAVFDLGRRLLPRGGALLLAALYASSPIQQLVTGSLFVENFWSLTLVAAFASLVRYRETGEARWALAAAGLLGGGVAAKYGGIAFLLPAAVLLGAELRRRRAMRLLPALLLLLAVFGSHPYARAYFETGNPVFPFFNDVFRSPQFDSQKAFVDRRYDRPLTPATFYTATFHTSRHLEGQNGGWAFEYLLFVPLALLYLRRDSLYLEQAAAAIALTFAVLTLAGQSNIRYLSPALPLLALLIGGLFARLARQDRGALRAAVAAAAVLFVLNLYCLPASGWYHKDFSPGVLNAAGRARYLQTAAPVRNLVEWLNRHRPGEPVVFAENNHIAGLRGRAFTTSWHNQAFAAELGETASPAACLLLLERHGLRTLVAPAAIERVTNPALRRLLFAAGQTEAESGGWRVVRLPPGSAKVRMPDDPAGPGEYDDMDPRVAYAGVWHGDRQFDGPAGGSVTYSARPGARACLRFTGGRITYVYTKAANRGRALVTVDGSRTVLDLYSPASVWQARSSFAAPGGGSHRFEVEVLPGPNPPSSGSYVDVDALIVEP